MILNCGVCGVCSASGTLDWELNGELATVEVSSGEMGTFNNVKDAHHNAPLGPHKLPILHTYFYPIFTLSPFKIPYFITFNSRF